mgnify:FL=1
MTRTSSFDLRGALRNNNNNNKQECQDAVVNALAPALSEGVDSITDLLFLPWGNAYVNISKCGTEDYSKQAMYCWIQECGVSDPDDACFDESNKICQHSTEECDANLAEACARKYSPSQYAFVSFLACFEKAEGDMSALESCASDSKIDVDNFNTCRNSSEGVELDMNNARATAQFGSSRLGTPWIVVNGKHIDTPSDLREEICKAYTGTDKPKGCTSSSSSRNLRQVSSSPRLC